jgi:hypothetical protein
MVKEKIYNFVYITTNTITGKQYIGDHSTNNLDAGYIGSGRPYFKNSLKKYGKESFKREIIYIREKPMEKYMGKKKENK